MDSAERLKIGISACLMHADPARPVFSSKTLQPGARRVKVNSIHHQAIKGLAPGFAVEAVSDEDGVVEAIRRTDTARPYLAAARATRKEPGT